jgi:hypothetical protein
VVLEALLISAQCSVVLWDNVLVLNPVQILTKKQQLKKYKSNLPQPHKACSREWQPTSKQLKKSNSSILNLLKLLLNILIFHRTLLR